MPILRLLVCLLVFTRITHAENTPGGPDPASIEHKVLIKQDQELYFRFQAKLNRLIEPQSYKGKPADKEMIKIELMNGGPAPGRVLVVNNNFGRTLRFRVLERLEGKTEFAKLSKNVIKIGHGQQWCHFWPDSAPIDEAILYQFSLSDELQKDDD